MADATVSELAEVVGVSVDKLLSQIKEAGLPHTKAKDTISNDDKNTLLLFLRRSHGDRDALDAAPRKITLKRKTIATLKSASSRGRGKTVNVEVRKKRTYVKRSAVVDDEVMDESLVKQEPPAADAASSESAATPAQSPAEATIAAAETTAAEATPAAAPSPATIVANIITPDAEPSRADKPGAKRKGQIKKGVDDPEEEKKGHLKNKAKAVKRQARILA